MAEKRNDAIMTIVAVEVGNHNHGSFLTFMARAWLVADPKNKSFIRTAWSNIINRYELLRVYGKEIKEHLPEYLEG